MPINLPPTPVEWYYTIYSFSATCPGCNGVIPANTTGWEYTQYANGWVVRQGGPFCANCYAVSRRQFDRNR
ncbi:hypothetical protein BJY04DRAFT_219707 [Aspergillus karnatakaensis]|uniref:uncharacterized protein n=1 Tax=Aspergillus karnatakaensis TaxID=1810916 RepID=UPI003CCE0B87